MQWHSDHVRLQAITALHVDCDYRVVRSGRVVRVGASVAVHREKRVPSADGLADAQLVQIHLRAAQSLVVFEAHAPLPHHDDDVAAKDVRALRFHGDSLSLRVTRLGNYMGYQ